MLGLSYGFTANTQNTIFRRLFRFLLFLSMTVPAWSSTYLLISPYYVFKITLEYIVANLVLLLCFGYFWSIETLFNGGKQMYYDKLVNIYMICEEKR